MASGNPFELLVDDDSEDLSQLISSKLKKIETKITVASPVKAPQSQAKLPSKPLAPTQADLGVRGGRGGGHWNGRGRGRGAGGMTHREYGNNGSSYGSRDVSGGRGPSRGGHRGSYSNGYGNHERSPRQSESHNGYGNHEQSPRQSERHNGGPFRGGHRGSYSNGYGNHVQSPRQSESHNRHGNNEQSPRQSESHNGTGSDFEQKGGDAGNWETQTDEPAKVVGEVTGEGEENVKKSASTKNGHAKKNGQAKWNGQTTRDGRPLTEEEIAKGRADRQKEREEDAKKMTLAQYEKLMEEKRKALQSTSQTEGRRIEDKDFETMKKISNKNPNDEVFYFAKSASEKEKKKQSSEKEEKAKKAVMSINEFLKPAEGERGYFGGGRGRRNQGGRDNDKEESSKKEKSAPRPVYVEDPGQFPTLGGN